MKTLRKKNYVALLLCWTLLFASLLIFDLYKIQEHTDNLAKTTARANFNKDQAVRYWAASHGGVYVAVDSTSPPNPHLSHIQERDIETPSGQKLTLVNPAYMMRQLNKYFSENYGVFGHLTSKKLLRPENKPDAWELDALNLFEKGVKEVSGYSEVRGEPYLRLMQPLLIKQSCLKCHGHQDYKIGDVRGGISVSTPMRLILERASQQKNLHIFGYTSLWLIGLVSLAFSYIKLGKSLQKQEQTETLLKSQNEELKEAKDSISIKEKKLLEAQKIGHLGHWELDLINNSLIWSDEIYRMFGISPQEFDATYESFLENIHPEDRQMVDEAYTNSLKFKTPYEIEHRLLLKSGELKYVYEKCHTEYNEDGTPIHSIGTVLDITAQKKTEFELKKQNQEFAALNIEFKAQNKQLKKAKDKAEESDRFKSAFLANMSHEIRTPMNGIIGFSNLLNQRDLSEAKREEFTDTINKSCQQLLGIVNDIIDISKIQTGLIEIKKEATSINNVFTELYSFYKQRALSNGIELSMYPSFSGNEDIVFTDKVKLRQILDNLLSNAMKFTHSGHIEYGYKLKDNKLEFSVQDTGIGISDEEQQIIFGRFNQAKHDIAINYGGTGLGLSIAKAYVEKLDGDIWVKSEEGKGSTFFFTLPYNPIIQEINESPPTLKNITTNKKITVMVVEDDDINFLLINEIFLILNAEILRAKTGAEAIEHFLNNKRINLVLMDIKLPDISGFEVTKQLISINDSVPIIAQTAYALEGDEEKALNAGCVDYISKPIDRNILIHKINQYT